MHVIAIVAALSSAPISTHEAPHTSAAREMSARFVARARPQRRRHEAGVARPSGDLFSLRARRRFAAYLRIRLLEMREAGLERAAQAVERRLPVEELLDHER
jgi:hypothetical protein